MRTKSSFSLLCLPTHTLFRPDLLLYRKFSKQYQTSGIKDKSHGRDAPGYICFPKLLCQEFTPQVEHNANQQCNDKNMNLKWDIVNPLIHYIGEQGKYNKRQKC